MILKAGILFFFAQITLKLTGRYYFVKLNLLALRSLPIS